ncbi:DUF4232 domain-containing protein [Streptomyces spectabilis]|uniref:DUF4232 domain-containing protein n=1 Tax=Streptomyces spectabilis TaxID=68270 RepID=A0A516RFT8_STRST|nr:DUF4232 domain-containing protein [Streptomyces spectabilis]QDQ14515.1 DUF4232 domain-containing protein [Streptomyces spectabilis]
MSRMPPGRAAALGAAVAALLVTGCGQQDGRDEGAGNAPGAGVPSHPVTADSLDPDTFPRRGAELSEQPPQPSRDCAGRTGTLLEPGPVDSAMGLRAMTVWLTHCGSGTYRLNGYPTLQVLAEDGTAFDVHSLRGAEPITTGVRDPGPHPVTLRHGESATAGVVWRNTYTDTTEDPVNGTRLQVLPAPGRPARTVAPDGGIDLGSTGRIGATAWRKAPAAETGQSRPAEPGAGRPTAPVPSTPAS